MWRSGRFNTMSCNSFFYEQTFYSQWMGESMFSNWCREGRSPFHTTDPKPDRLPDIPDFKFCCNLISKNPIHSKTSGQSECHLEDWTLKGTISWSVNLKHLRSRYPHFSLSIRVSLVSQMCPRKLNKRSSSNFPGGYMIEKHLIKAG